MGLQCSFLVYKYIFRIFVSSSSANINLTEAKTACRCILCTDGLPSVERQLGLLSEVYVSCFSVDKNGRILKLLEHYTYSV